MLGTKEKNKPAFVSSLLLATELLWLCFPVYFSWCSWCNLPLISALTWGGSPNTMSARPPVLAMRLSTLTNLCQETALLSVGIRGSLPLVTLSSTGRRAFSGLSLPGWGSAGRLVDGAVTNSGKLLLDVTGGFRPGRGLVGGASLGSFGGWSEGSPSDSLRGITRSTGLGTERGRPGRDG
jgi:hypothetical protein